jgi:phosphatidylglycerophosphate synthase
VNAPSPELVVDARASAGGVTPFASVAGVPLVARHVRQAARAGRGSVLIVVADEKGRAAALRAIAARPAPTVRVDVAIGAPPAGADVVAALTVAGPGFVTSIAGPDDLVVAERSLYAALRKGVDLDGFVAYHLLRPLARGLTRLLIGTRVTPNQVTLAALALGLIAAGAAAAGHFVAAGLLYWAGGLVDCVDGEIARLRLEGSRAGEWLDSLADEAATFALMAGVGSALSGPFAALAVVGVVSGAASVGKLYSDLNRLGLPIDTAQYPWFFARSAVRAGFLARAVYAASFLFKRDAYSTLVSLCLVAGVPRVAFLLLFGGIEVITVLLLVHLAVTHEAPRSSG